MCTVDDHLLKIIKDSFKFVVQVLVSAEISKIKSKVLSIIRSRDIFVTYFCNIEINHINIKNTLRSKIYILIQFLNIHLKVYI